MIPIETQRLLIRAFKEPDRALFHEINSDDKVMEFYPYRRTRAQSDALFDIACAETPRTGYGFTAVEIKASGVCIGYCCLAFPKLAPIFPEETVEIGWRVAVRHWGNGYVTEAAKVLLADGFTKRGLDEIISFAVPANLRSLAVMQRIGMHRDPSRDFDHPRINDDYGHLKHHITYRLSKNEWEGSHIL